MMSQERVPFRMMQMPCCKHMVCWVNPRLPNFCPECGQIVSHRIRECVVVLDDRAFLHVSDNAVKVALQDQQAANRRLDVEQPV